MVLEFFIFSPDVSWVPSRPDNPQTTQPLDLYVPQAPDTPQAQTELSSAPSVPLAPSTWAHSTQDNEPEARLGWSSLFELLMTQVQAR